MFIVSVIVESNCHILQFYIKSYYTLILAKRPPCCCMDDALKLATPVTNGTINETLTFHKVVERHT